MKNMMQRGRIGTSRLLCLICSIVSGCVHRDVVIDHDARSRLLTGVQVIREVDRFGGSAIGPYIDLDDPPTMVTVVRIDSSEMGIDVDSMIVRWGSDRMIKEIMRYHNGNEIRRSVFRQIGNGLHEIIHRSDNNRSVLRAETPYVDTVIWTAKANGETGCVTVGNDDAVNGMEQYCLCPDDSSARRGKLDWNLEWWSVYEVNDGARTDRSPSALRNVSDGECDEETFDQGISVGEFIIHYDESDNPFFCRVASIADYGIDGVVIDRTIGGLEQGETLTEKQIRDRIARENFTGADTLRLDVSSGLPVSKYVSWTWSDYCNSRTSGRWTRWRYDWTMRKEE